MTAAHSTTLSAVQTVPNAASWIMFKNKIASSMSG